MAYASVWDFGSVTFINGTTSVSFDTGIGIISFEKIYSSESINDATGEIYLGSFLGFRATIKISPSFFALARYST